MDKRTRSGIVTALLLTGAALFLWHFSGISAPPEIRCWCEEFPVMGTVARFTFYTADRKKAERASRAAKEEFARISRMADLHDPASELSRLNASAASENFRCSPELFALLERSQRASRESGGRFDVTVKPLMDLWGFYRKRGDAPPSDAEIRDVLQKVGSGKLILDKKDLTVRFSRPGMALDLGGVAKGYAADLAAQAAEKEGIAAGVIDLGGNLRFLPEAPPGKKEYTVAIRDPRDTGKVLPQRLAVTPGTAVATSGDYERFIILDERRYGHIISPLSGMPVAGKAVTVTAPTALDADILSTSCYLAGERESGTILRFVPGSKAYFVPAE